MHNETAVRVLPVQQPLHHHRQNTQCRKDTYIAHSPGTLEQFQHIGQGQRCVDDGVA